MKRAMELVVKQFDELSTRELYNLLKLRQDVFVIEQQSIYEDLDNEDFSCFHVMGCEGDSLIAYSRILKPKSKYEEASIGRIIITKNARGTGKGQELIQFSIDNARFNFPGCSIRISAQQHLQKFYNKFGFEMDSAPYDDGGIMHVEMVLTHK